MLPREERSVQSTQVNATALTTPASKGSEGGMVEMEYQGKMAKMESKDEMEPKEDKDWEEALVCQDRGVCKFVVTIHL